jgi:AcrR family transcriptional regulator
MEPAGSEVVDPKAGVPEDAGAVKRAKRMPRAVRERQMLDAAVRTFGQRGYRAASMDDIAELAGVSKPLVYLYLRSKEDLFTACIRREAEALVKAVREGVDPQLPAERQLWEGLRSFFTYTATHPDGWSVLHTQARTHGEPFSEEVGAMRREIIEFITALIAAAGRETLEKDVERRAVSGLAHALVGAAESLADWANANAAVTAKDAAATMMNFAWTGLAGLQSGTRWTPPRGDGPGEAGS